MKLKFLAALADNLSAKLPFTRRAQLPARYDTPNVATSAKVSDIQSMIRAAEGGDPSRLFAYYRDLTISGSHVQSEFSKRKLAILGDSMAVLPADKNKPEDVTAAQACEQAIRDCENWTDGLTYLMDSCLYPVSVAEHLFRATNQPGDAGRAVALRYTLKRIEPVPYALLCFQHNYSALTPAAAAPPEQWEADLRFWPTNEMGAIVKDVTKAYPADPLRHLVHRGHLLIGVRDNWGGPMRAILFWNLLTLLGRDWFARLMERFGNPFIVGRTDKSDKEAVQFLQEALALSTKIGGLVVDESTQIDLKEAMLSGAADGYEKFLGVCHREISKVIVGQDLSAQSASTGLGSGVANLQAAVRQDIRMFDQLKLGETLTKQLFTRFLRINGLTGAPPVVRFGGLSPEEARETGALLVSLAQANLEPTDEALPLLSERIGFQIQRKAAAPLPAGGGFANNSLPLRARLTPLAAQQNLADALGVPATWLNPVADYLAAFEQRIADKNLSDADLLALLEKLTARVPELFGRMAVDDLAEVFEKAMGQEVLNAARQSVKRIESSK